MSNATHFPFKDILVTGASGFIGSAVVAALLEHTRESRIIAVCRDPKKTAGLFADPAGRVKITAWEMAAPLSYSGRVDAMLHIAGKGDPVSHAARPAETMRDTLSGCINALEFARDRNVARFILVSSGEIYGCIPGDEPIREDDQGPVSPLPARSCYPLSKLATESLSLAYSRQYGISVSIARLCHVYGPGIDTNDPRIAALFFREAAAGRNIVLKSPGDQLRSLCYITDAASAVLAVLDRGETHQAYNVAAHDSELTVAAFARRIADSAGVHVVFDLPDATEAQAFNPMPQAVFATEKLQNLGWRPLTNIADGITKTLEYFKYANTRKRSAP